MTATPNHGKLIDLQSQGACPMPGPANPVRLALAWPLAAGICGLAATLPAAASPTPLPEQPTTELPSDGGGLFTQAFFLELGFSFMIGLAMGFALKVAFKIALVVIGLILLALFGLQYVGFVEVNWSGIEVQYDGWVHWLSVNAGAFFGFVGRNLTSAASFLAGLALGLKF